MSPFDFAKVRNATDKEAATHAVFDEAYDRWDEDGRESLSEGQVAVLAVETFFGEVLNGGFWQYFSNESGDFANCAPACLSRVGLSEYAKVLETFLHLFPEGTVSEDIDERAEQIDALSEVYGEEFLEGLEQQFWNKFQDTTEFRDKLFAFVISNEKEFVT